MQTEVAKRVAELVTDIAKCACAVHTGKTVLLSFSDEPEKNAAECEQLRYVISENERDIAQAKHQLTVLLEQHVPAFGELRILPEPPIASSNPAPEPTKEKTPTTAA